MPNNRYFWALLNSLGLLPARFCVQSAISSNSIVLPASSIWTSVPGDWTVEAWIYVDNFKDYLTIIGMGTNGDEFGFFHWKASTALGVGTIKIYQTASGGDTVVASTGVVPEDTWTHVAITRRSSDATWCSYINGLPDLVNQPMVRTQTAAISNSGRHLCGDGVSEPFNGLTSDIRVWNVARSAAQILANYNRRLTGSEANLLGYWRLDDGPALTGTVAADSTSHAANGTLTTPTNIRFVTGGPSFLP